MTVRIAPSVLSADLAQLRDEISRVVEGGADWIHIDVMDGNFVPNITFGESLIEALRRVTDLPLDVHLMVLEPERYIEPFVDKGATVFTFHPEATTHVQHQLEMVKSSGLKAGLALNPGTPLSYAEEVVHDLDLLLVMTVNPGYAGQAFIQSSTQKIKRAREMLNTNGSTAFLEVDGGITRKTIRDSYEAGADTFVAGSAIFDSPDPAREVSELRRLCAD